MDISDLITLAKKPPLGVGGPSSTLRYSSRCRSCRLRALHAKTATKLHRICICRGMVFVVYHTLIQSCDAQPLEHRGE